MKTSTLILQSVITVCSAVITTIILPLLAQWISSKTSNERMKSAFTDLVQTVSTVVDFIEQTYVSNLKASNSWDEPAQQEALSLAIESVIQTISTSTTTWLENNSDDIRATIRQYIEAYIYSRKQEAESSEDNKN